jgi:hypothetical protein
MSQPTATASRSSASYSFLLRLALALVIVLLFALLSRAGGPKYVAGTTYFDPSTSGQPLTWPLGQVTYYTDLGDLSPILPSASADALVADAFSQWTSVSTAALIATNAGHLAEDVTGSNVIRNLDGSLTMPADIQPSATSTPVGIVYDDDGSVTDALLGSGAGDSTQCFFNASFGGADNFGTLANFQHALVVINGNCAQLSSQLTDLEYRLVRTLGGILGLGWSQVNINVVTGHPTPTADDFAGFPVMHYADLFSCVPITQCYPNPFQLVMDDHAAISRLYPVTAQNQASFPGKQVFSSTTARVHGSVWFADRSGKSTQPMQGVNVVARWIDPLTGQPSRRYAASSVAGFLYTGDAGNPITGFSDPLGNAYSRFGSLDAKVEGFFDLAGLQLPKGATSALYQLSVEPLDPLWSLGVGPYTPFEVAPSGLPLPIVVTLAPGMDLQQDIVMSGSALPVRQWAATETWTSPAAVPAAGDWVGSLNGYGDVAYFSLPAQANRTLSVSVMALDEGAQPSETKTQPVIGMWALADPQGTPPPAFTSSSFNSATFGLTRLDTQVFTSSNFRIGISDLRGDGRPDYHYHAHILYGDSVTPPRVSVNGGVVRLIGVGFAPGLDVLVGSANVTPMAVNAAQMILPVSAQSDGPQTLTITDPVSGAFSTMTSALTFGVAATDNIVLLEGLSPPTPVGTQASIPVVVRVRASDGVSVVRGATVGWSTTNNAALSVCAGAASCSSATDESGIGQTWVTPLATGVASITATLAPGVYTPSKSVSATLLATSSPSDIGVLNPNLWIAQAASISTPLTARVMSNGSPQSGSRVNFTIVAGTGSLSSTSAVTDSGGYATVNLTLTKIPAAIQVSACVAPANAPCQTIFGNLVPASQQRLQPVAGADQVTTSSQPLQPVTVRVTDSSSPPNPVLGATVAFQTTVMRPSGDAPLGGGGEDTNGNPAVPIILSISRTSAQSDVNGLASLTPSTGSFTGTLEIDVVATSGAGATLKYVLESLPAPSTASVSPVRVVPGAGRARFAHTPLPTRVPK